MAEIEKIIDKLCRLRSHLRVMCVGIHDDYYTNSVQTVEEAIQTIRELCDKSDELEEENFRLGDTVDELNITLTDAFEKIRELQSQIPKWHLVKFRPLTEEEKESYGEDYDFIYDCETPDDGQEVLVATKWGVDKTTFYTDCGWYFENYEDEGEVIAWMELPKFEREE